MTDKNIQAHDSDSSLFYQEQSNEVSLFEYAFEHELPVLIKGPTGCGKTRFIAAMAEKLGRPLYTVSCHDDLTAADLIGRFLIGKDGTFWQDGPLTRAVREGAIWVHDPDGDLAVRRQLKLGEERTGPDGQRLIEVGDDVFHIFDADRDADHIRRGACFDLLLGLELAVGGRGRVDDQRAGVAEIGHMAEDIQRIDQFDAGLRQYSLRR